MDVKSLRKRTHQLERVLDTGSSLEACRRADNGAQWAHEKTLELAATVEAQPFFQGMHNRMIIIMFAMRQCAAYTSKYWYTHLIYMYTSFNIEYA